MISRAYNKRIQLFEVTLETNPFGGNTPTETLLFASWAKVTTNGVGYKADDFGIDAFEDAVLFKVRYRNDFKYQGRTLLVKYRNGRYVIKGVRNIDVANLETELFCQREETELP